MRVDEKTGVMLRPTMRDDFVKRRAAEIILPEVRSWFRSQSFMDSDGEILSDLASVATQDDGFEIAKRLEDRCGWSPDSQLVELLSGTWCDDALREMTEQWVRCAGIKPKHVLGATVNYRTFGGEEEVGVITRIELERGEYGVTFPGMAPNSWRVIPFEKIDGV